MTYAQAMKAYFAKQGKPVSFPKKGSAEHSAICALMASGDLAAGSGVSAEAALASGEVKVKKPRGRGKAAAPKGTDNKPVAADSDAKTKLIDVPHLTEKVEKAIEENPEKPPVRKRKPRAVKADGLSPQQQLLKSDTEMNSGIKVAPAAYPDLKEQITKVLDVKPEGIPVSKEKIDKPVIQRSATQRKNKSPDMPAITERAPFSFSSIKQLLRQ